MNKIEIEKYYIHIFFIIIVIFSVGLVTILSGPIEKIASVFFGYDIEANKNVFGISNEISADDEYMKILEDVAYIFNMQETSVITNDNEVFFIREILDNNSVYIIVVKNSEGVVTISQNSWENQSDPVKDQVSKQIDILMDLTSNK